jgi:hypothetical protein
LAAEPGQRLPEGQVARVALQLLHLGRIAAFSPHLLVLMGELAVLVQTGLLSQEPYSLEVLVEPGRVRLMTGAVGHKLVFSSTGYLVAALSASFLLVEFLNRLPSVPPVDPAVLG